jgi:hypothetical protein
VPTLREEAEKPTALLILYGTLENPKLVGTEGKGTTELHIASTIRGDKYLGGAKMVVLPRYMPVPDPKNPPRCLVFCDVYENKLDPYRGVPIKSPEVVEYLKKASALNPKDRVNNLTFFFQYLDHSDKDIQLDAFMEFAKANDQLIAQVAPKLSAEKLRRWIESTATPSERVGLYAFLLGGCGDDRDAGKFHDLLKDGRENVLNAYDGIVSGLIHLRPREGWNLVHEMLRDGTKPFQQRLAVVRSIEFYQASQPEKFKEQILKAIEIMILQGELADYAVEDLRRWKLWDRTREVLALFGKKGYDAPIMQRTIVRYALCCPRDAVVTEFLNQVQKKDPELIKSQEELLQFEKK